MTKRIFDIVPPEEVQNNQASFLEEDNEDFLSDSVSLSKKSKEIKKQTKKSKDWIKWFVLIFAFGILATAFFVPAKAEINIFPKTDAIQITDIFTIDPNQTQVNLETKTLPGIAFSSTQDVVQKYNTTGTDSSSKKAKGIIRVYSKYSPAEALTLKSGTHFLSPKGLSYHSLAVINIPAATISNGKVTPGYVDIEIEADEVGADYNLSSATFSVPKLNGTAYYSTTWAEIKEAITGGTSGSIKIASKQDIDSAKEDFKIKAKEQGLISLKNQISSDYIVFDDMISQTLSNIVANVKEKDIVADFSVSGNIVSESIAFRMSDLNNIAEQLMISSNNQIKQLVPSTVKCDITDHKTNKEGLIEITTNCSAKTYWLPDNAFLMQNLGGKSKDYSASILNNFSEIDKVQVNISPFWKINVPKDSKNINIKLIFE